MPAEGLFDGYVTTLGANVLATDTVIPVPSTAGLDATKQYRMRIDSGVGVSATFELLLVQVSDATHFSVVGGTAGRGIETTLGGTVAAAHFANDAVSIVLTAAGLSAYIGALDIPTVTAADATIVVGGPVGSPTVGVGVIPESKVTNLTADLAARVTGVTAADATIVVGGTAGAPTVAVGTLNENKVLGPAKRPGALWVALGDSITAAADLEVGFNGATNSYYANSWITYAIALLLGRVQRVRNVGISGNTSAQMLARFDTDVTPLAPTLVTILAGTNDIAAVSLASFQSNIIAMVAKCRAISAVPVLCTIPPNNTNSHTKISQFNAWLHRYSIQQGLVLLDFFAQLVDYTNGNYLASLNSGDGTHPNAAGYAALGQYVANSLGPMLPFDLAPLAQDDTDPNNLLSHGLNNGAVTSGRSAGWAQYSGLPGGCTESVTTATGIAGKVQQVACVATATDNLIYQSIAGTKFSVGDRLLITGLFTATGIGMKLQANYNGGSPGSSTPLDITQPVALGLFYQEYVVPAGTTSIDLLFTARAGTGTVQIGQQTVYNLTALGVL